MTEAHHGLQLLFREALPDKLLREPGQGVVLLDAIQGSMELDPFLDLFDCGAGDLALAGVLVLLGLGIQATGLREGVF